MESWVLALYHGHSSRLLSENCITNSRCTASNCNCQYVSQFCSSDHDVASECENPKRGKKLKYPRNLSLKEIKSCYRDKLPVGLLALGYITPSTSPEGPLFEICPSLNGISAFIFTTTSILFLASTKWYLSTSIFTPQLKYVISIDWFTFAVFVLHGRIAKTEIHRSFPHSCFTISVVKVSPDYYGFKSSLGLTFPLL